MKFLPAVACLLLFFLVASVCCRDLTLQTVVGTVAADNYTYYTLSYNGPVSLVLESIEGDADVYVSQWVLHPSYDVQEHCLRSATCGVDRVDLPSTFRRPIGVAVYGHVLHPVSTFRLTVLLRDDAGADGEWNGSDWIDDDGAGESVRKTGAEEVGKTPRHGDEQSVFSSMLWTFLEILLEVLFA